MDARRDHLAEDVAALGLGLKVVDDLGRMLGELHTRLIVLSRALQAAKLVPHDKEEIAKSPRKRKQ